MADFQLVLGGLCTALAVLVALWLRARMRSWRAVHRARRAKRGELRAEKLLRKRGYQIDDRQATLRWAITVDGLAHECLLRADLLVSKGERRYVAEVKTGSLAPKVGNVSTRRQLLEYRVAYQVDGVLLVVPEQNRVMELEFPHLDA